jgi:hypothetical protein
VESRKLRSDTFPATRCRRMRRFKVYYESIKREPKIRGIKWDEKRKV